MPINYIQGDIFQAKTDAIVNTVNCVGVMGKGIALEFKKRWPKNYQEYRILCEKKVLKTGKMFVFQDNDMFENSNFKYLVNFPTKDNWRSKSKLSYIDEGLDDFIIQIKELGIKSIALPTLGCGNGGLEWADVRKLIENKLSGIDDVQFLVFVSKENIPEPEFQGIPSDMTIPRAILVKTLGDFEKFFGGHFTKLSVQKLSYFLQVLGVNFNLQFQKDQFGPYSEKLSIALRKLEKSNYISGYTDTDPKITARSSAYTMADEYLINQSNSDHEAIINKLSNLIEGYESPYGMELLASVHYLYSNEGIKTVNETLKAFKEWNTHKKSSFGLKEINSALDRLKSDSLIH